MPDILYTSPRTQRVYQWTPEDPSYEPTDDDRKKYAAYIEQQETDTEQSALEATLMGIPRGAAKIPGTVVEGLGALTGMEEVRQQGKRMVETAETEFPLDPTRREDFIPQAGEAVGQAVGLLATAPFGAAAGLGTVLTMGASEGANTAEAKGLEGPRKYLEIYGKAGIAAGVERLGGFGTKDFLTGYAGKTLGQSAARALKTTVGEGLEEGAEAFLGRTLENISTLGTDIEAPDILSAEAFSEYGRNIGLGMVGGTVFAAAQYGLGKQAMGEVDPEIPATPQAEAMAAAMESSGPTIDPTDLDLQAFEALAPQPTVAPEAEIAPAPEAEVPVTPAVEPEVAPAPTLEAAPEVAPETALTPEPTPTTAPVPTPTSEPAPAILPQEGQPTESLPAGQEAPMAGVSGEQAVAPTPPVQTKDLTTGPTAKRNVDLAAFRQRQKALGAARNEEVEGDTQNFILPPPKPDEYIPPRVEPFSVPFAKQTIQKIFGTLPDNVSLVTTNERTASGQKWAGRANVRTGQIQINLQNINSVSQLEEVLREEAVHLVYQDPMVQADVDLLKQAIPPDIAAEIARNYDQDVSTEEAVVKMVERFRNDQISNSLWQRFLDTLRAAFRKAFNRTPSPRELSLAANKILERAVANVAVQPSGQATGQRMSVTQSPEAARHAELEAKFNAGTITPEETAEAKRAVAKRAKAAGYNRTGVRFGYYLNGVPLPPAEGGNFGPGYYVAENAERGVGASTVGVSKTPDPEVLRKLGLPPGSVEYREDNVFVKAAAPYWSESGSNATPETKAFIDATVAYESAIQDANRKLELPSERVSFMKVVSNLIAQGRIPFDSVQGGTGRPGMSSELVVQNPSQIKSADPFTGVPLDQRFNPESSDIRYSVIDQIDPRYTNKFMGEKVAAGDIESTKAIYEFVRTKIFDYSQPVNARTIAAARRLLNRIRPQEGRDLSWLRTLDDRDAVPGAVLGALYMFADKIPDGGAFQQELIDIATRGKKTGEDFAYFFTSLEGVGTNRQGARGLNAAGYVVKQLNKLPAVISNRAVRLGRAGKDLGIGEETMEDLETAVGTGAEGALVETALDETKTPGGTDVAETVANNTGETTLPSDDPKKTETPKSAEEAAADALVRSALRKKKESKEEQELNIVTQLGNEYLEKAGEIPNVEFTKNLVDAGLTAEKAKQVADALDKKIADNKAKEAQAAADELTEDEKVAQQLTERWKKNQEKAAEGLDPTQVPVVKEIVFRFLKENGSMSEAQLNQELADIGLSDQYKDPLVSYTALELARRQKAKADKRQKEKKVKTSDEVAEALTALYGKDPAVKEEQTIHEATKIARRYLSFKGSQDRSELLKRLEGAGVSPEKANNLADSLDKELENRRRTEAENYGEEATDEQKSARSITATLSVSQSDTLFWRNPKKVDKVKELVKKFYDEGPKMTPAMLDAELELLGLPEADRNPLVSVVTRERELKVRIAEIRKAEKDALTAAEAAAVNSADVSALKLISRLAKSQSDTPSWGTPKKIDEIADIVAAFYKADGATSETMLDAELEAAGVSDNPRSILVRTAARELADRQRIAEIRAAEKVDPRNDAERDADSIVKRFAKSQSDTLDFGKKKGYSEVTDLVNRFFAARGAMSETSLDQQLETLGLPEAGRVRLINIARRELQIKEQVRQAKDAERAANKPTEAAQKFVDSFDQSQTEWMPNERQPDPVREFLEDMARVKKGEIGFDLDADNKRQFFDIVQTRLLAMNVDPKTAWAATDRAWSKYLRNRSDQVLEFRRKIADLGTPNAPKTKRTNLIRAISERLLEISPSQQRDPAFVRSFLKQVLLDAGMTEAGANASVPIMIPSFYKALAQSKENALRKFIDGNPIAKARLKKEKLPDLIKAVRLTATDPNYSPSEPFAKVNKWQKFTAAEHDAMAKLAEEMMDPNVTTLDKNLAQTKLYNIAARKITDRKALIKLAEVYRNSALSNFFSTGGIQVWTPVFSAIARLFTDGIVGLVYERNANRFIASVEAMMRAASPASLKAELAVSFSKDVTTFDKAYEMEGIPELKILLEDSIQTFKTTKNPVAKVKSFFGIVYGSLDFVRRTYSALDNMTQSVFYKQISDMGMRDVVLGNKGTSDDFKALIERYGFRKEQIMADLIFEGRDPKEALINADERARAELNGYIIDQFGTTEDLKQSLKEELDKVQEIARREAPREIGVGSDKDLDGFLIPMVIGTIKGLTKAANDRVEGSGQFTSLFLFGFPITALKFLNRSLDYSPIGILRLFNSQVLEKMNEGDPNYVSRFPNYKEQRQRRQREAEAALGSLIFMALIFLVVEERDKDPEDRLFMVHNTGPRNKAAKQTWRGAGNVEQSIQWRPTTDSPWLSVSWAKAGMEVFGPVLATLGAIFDATDPTIRREDSYDIAMVFLGQILATANRPLSSIQDVASIASGKEASLSSRSLANQLGFRLSTLAPWSAMLRNYNKWQGPRDTTSAESAFLSMIPLVGPSLTEPGLNAFGDPVSLTPNEISYKAGTVIPVSVGFNRKEIDFYEFILKRGKFPTVKERPATERTYGKLDDKTWREYIEVRGKIIKKLISERIPQLDAMDQEQYDKMIERFTKFADDSARAQLKLRPLPK